MDHKVKWIALRNEIYANLKTTRYPAHPRMKSFANVLIWMIDVEDEPRGVDMSERHSRDLGVADVIALYEAHERETA